MLTFKDVQRVDRSRLHEDYDQWQQYARRAFVPEPALPEPLSPSGIVFAGMGGSGTVGDLIYDWLGADGDIPIQVIKDYHLPTSVKETALVIAISYSGNTEETVSIALEALQRGCTVVTISSGGLLETVSRKRGNIHLAVPTLKTPRSAFPCLFYTAARILLGVPIGRARRRELIASIHLLGRIGRHLSPAIALRRNPAKRLAPKLLKVLPVIYGSTLNRSVALRFKAALNENAKLPALVDILPELCHNELASWPVSERTARRPILLRLPNEPPEIATRFQVVKEILQSKGYRALEVKAQGATRLEQLISTLYLLDYTALYAAVLRGVDPNPTSEIDFMKERLKTTLNYLGRYGIQLE